MDLTLVFNALVMGIVEGLTEFLPISSTGHLILAGSLLDFTGPKVQVFEIAIQVGALLAIFWQYRERMISVSTGFITRPRDRRFALNVVIGSVPAIVMGLLFARQIQGDLFSPVPVALGFIAGALVILWVEKRYKARPDL